MPYQIFSIKLQRVYTKTFDGAAVGFVGSPNSFDLSNNSKPGTKHRIKKPHHCIGISTGLSLVIKCPASNKNCLQTW